MRFRTKGSGLRSVWLAGLAASLLASAATAQDKRCEMKQIGALPVATDSGRPLIDGRINGKPVRILADTGATTSIVFRETVVDQGLTVKDAGGSRLFGVDGEVRIGTVAFDTFQLGDYTISDREFLVINQASRGSGIAMLIGLDLFSRADVEFDLKNNMIRLFRPANCGDAPLAYWGPDHGVVDFRRSAYFGPQFVVETMLNGKPVTALIDSGATTSVITLEAAARIGVKVGDANVAPQQQASGGLAGGALPTWIGTFDSFSIGDETIKNAKLAMAELYGKNTAVPTGSRVGRQVFQNPDMILGADFLRSHRVLVSNDQKKVYFSYVGGPVFQTRGIVRRPQEAAAAP